MKLCWMLKEAYRDKLQVKGRGFDAVSDLPGVMKSSRFLHFANPERTAIKGHDSACWHLQFILPSCRGNKSDPGFGGSVY